MGVVSATDAAYADANNTSIRCTVTFDDRTGEYSYLAVNGDPASQVFFNALVAGTYGAVSAYQAPTIPLASLASQAQAAAKVAAAEVVSEVMPDASHQEAFQNAASILNGNGGSPPTTEPLATAFNSLASAYGLSPTSFAAIILGAQAASLSLAAALSAFPAASAAATSNTALEAALAAFEGAVSSVVTAVNAVLPTPIANPPAIVIVGLNG